MIDELERFKISTCHKIPEVYKIYFNPSIVVWNSITNVNNIIQDYIRSTLPKSDRDVLYWNEKDEYTTRLTKITEVLDIFEYHVFFNKSEDYHMISVTCTVNIIPNIETDTELIKRISVKNKKEETEKKTLETLLRKYGPIEY